MDVLIVEDDQEQLDGIESILLEKYDHMNCIKATNYQQKSPRLVSCSTSKGGCDGI